MKRIIHEIHRRSLPVVGFLLGAPGLLAAQSAGLEESSSAGSAVAGAVAGAFSGAVLGAAGSIVPCSQTYAGPYCVRASAAMSGAIAMTSGLVIGSSDRDQINDRLAGSAIGFVIGGGAALALSPFIQRFEPQDALAVGMLGGAIGASPRGAVIGLGAGAAIGFILWRALPDFEAPNALGAALAGLALGGLADWTASAINAESKAESPVFSLTVPVP